MKNSTLSVALRLFIITTLTALCITGVNLITEPIITNNSEKAQKEAKMEVLPQAKAFASISFSDTEIPKSAENGVRANRCAA